MSDALLEVEDLKVYYAAGARSLWKRKAFVKAVDGVSFSVRRQEAFGIVGESGCGKSTTGYALVGLIKPYAGDIRFDGTSIVGTSNRHTREQARKIQMIFQDPYSSLDPRFTVASCIAEPLAVHHWGTKAERKERVAELMREVGLNRDQMTRYPHEFSGGQRQRIGIARALALNPELIVCDEPVSALDVSIQAQVLNLLQELKDRHGLTYLFISHNLSVVYHLCERVAVMYLGHVVEIASREELFGHPAHPYTKALLAAIPVPDPDKVMMRDELKGDVPSPLNPPSGCCFHTRCPFAKPICGEEVPVLKEVGGGHKVACHFA